ncbi:MAG: SPOR domain-containing protein [Chitinophagaceae bacterium]
MKMQIALILILVSANLYAQEADSIIVPASRIVHRDIRVDMLGKKLAELNANEKKMQERTAMGFRLQVLSTNDREHAMKTRTSLLQKFPEQKTYMFYQAPFVKIRFGNFRSKQDAEIYKKQISRMLGGASIYTVAERIEVKPEKDREIEEEN